MRKRCIVCHRKLKKSHGPVKYSGFEIDRNAVNYACRYGSNTITSEEALDRNWFKFLFKEAA